MDITQTDAEMASNEPIEVFSIQDGGKSIKYKIRALPISKADAWMEKANAVEALQLAVKEAQKGTDRVALAAARKAYNEAVYECVSTYPIAPEPPQALHDYITPTQMGRAFTIMQMVNDPFVSAELAQLNVQKQMLKGLPMKMLEKIPQRVIEQHLNTNGSTRDS